MKIEEFKVEDYLESEEMCLGFLNEALKREDPEYFQEALGVVARAQGMGAVAKGIGVGRESLYKSLSAAGNPRFGTVMDVLDALGYRFVVQRNAHSAQ